MTSTQVLRLKMIYSIFKKIEKHTQDMLNLLKQKVRRVFAFKWPNVKFYPARIFKVLVLIFINKLQSFEWTLLLKISKSVHAGINSSSVTYNLCLGKLSTAGLLIQIFFSLSFPEASNQWNGSCQKKWI